MTQTSNRFFDEVARLMNDAAGVAQGVRREFDTVFRNQAERILRDLDVVKREEFEAVKEMARLAREENEALKARIAALEAKLAARRQSARAARRIAGTCRSEPLPVLAVFAVAFLVFTPACAAISRATAAPTPLEACRGMSAFPPFQKRIMHHGDRQADEGDGASAGRQGGRPGRTSRRPRAGRDLRRRQAAAYRSRSIMPSSSSASMPGASSPRSTTSRSTAPSTASSRAISSSTPVKDLPVHVDFLRLGEGAHIRVRIPVHVMNADQSPGVKRGGTVNIVTHAVEVRCRAETSRNRSTSISPASRSTIRSI